MKIGMENDMMKQILMRSIKEKAEESSTNFRKEQGDVGYSEQLSYKLGFETGANYVLDIISDVLDEYNRETAYYDVKGAIRELKGDM